MRGHCLALLAALALALSAAAAPSDTADSADKRGVDALGAQLEAVRQRVAAHLSSRAAANRNTNSLSSADPAQPAADPAAHAGPGRADAAARMVELLQAAHARHSRESDAADVEADEAEEAEEAEETYPVQRGAGSLPERPMPPKEQDVVAAALKELLERRRGAAWQAGEVGRCCYWKHVKDVLLKAVVQEEKRRRACAAACNEGGCAVACTC